MSPIIYPIPPRGVVLEGDVLTRTAELPAASIDTIVTSPPYFRLRRYGGSTEIGLEDAVDDWAERLRVAAQEWARVLVPTGTLWLNLGDTYSTHPRQGADRKGLLLGPERVALALSNDGWILRNKIVWSKPSTTPTSVRDRLATKHEVNYVFARSGRYFFDLDSIRVPHTSKPPRPRLAGKRPAARPAWLGPNGDSDQGLAAMHRRGIQGHPLGKNPGDVWTMSVSRYAGAHFATYPVHLAERMLLAGCPERRCRICRAPWTRRLQRSGDTATRLPLAPTCEHTGPPEPGLVLDPFMGSGTTAVAAEKLDRDWLGIELNPDFAALARDRITTSRTRSASKRKEVA